jgi:uncharacterized protein (DUF1778 family)
MENNQTRADRCETGAPQVKFVLGEASWRLFMKTFDRPAEEKPRLRMLFTEAHAAMRRD